MNIYNVISLLFGSGILLAIFKAFGAKFKKEDEKIEAVCLGVQALLRDRLYQAYDYWSDKQYAPVSAKENFENMYTQYHHLGMNGVMDEHYKNFMRLPDKKPEEVSTHES